MQTTTYSRTNVDTKDLIPANNHMQTATCKQPHTAGAAYKVNTTEQLLKQLNGEGVEYKTLGEVCTIIKGTQLNRANMNQRGSFPVINGGVEASGYVEVFNQDENTITVSGGGTSAGYVRWMAQKFWLGAHCFAVIAHDGVSEKYLFYCIKSQEGKLRGRRYGAGIPTLAKSTLEKLVIPLPSLPLQKKIAEILDIFVELDILLRAELDLRKKQYAYYRNRLLSFDSNVARVALSDVFFIRNGYTPSKQNPAFWEAGFIPWFRVNDIKNSGDILCSSAQMVTAAAAGDRGLFPANSILCSTVASVGKHALVTVDCLANQQFSVLSLKPSYQDKILVRFAYYYCFVLDEWCSTHIRHGSVPLVDMNGFKNFPFPVAPLDVQRNIVSALDAFNEHLNSNVCGLNAEIKARRKQYDYLCSKLLVF